MSNSMIISNEKSQFNNDDLYVTYTRKSSNKKTGNVPTIMFLCANHKPTEAVKNGADNAVCGNCILKPINGKDKLNSCYVNKGFAPNSVYKAIGRGNVPGMLPNAVSVDVQRSGGYGDNASVSKGTNFYIMSLAKITLCYTHNWLRSLHLRHFSMASVHSKAEALKAQSLGFRTFRISDTACEKLLPNEIVCPNFKNNKIQCRKCKLCSGLQRSGAKSIVIPKHK